MIAKTVFYLRIQDKKNRRVWHESRNYKTIDELYNKFKYWLEEHNDTPVIFAQRIVMIPQ